MLHGGWSPNRGRWHQSGPVDDGNDDLDMTVCQTADDCCGRSVRVLQLVMALDIAGERSPATPHSLTRDMGRQSQQT